MLVVESAGENDRTADVRTRRISASRGVPVAPDAATSQNTHHPARDRRPGRLVFAPGAFQRRVERDPPRRTLGPAARAVHGPGHVRAARDTLAVLAQTDRARQL